MRTIDADSHIFESQETWNYIPRSQEAHKPVLVMTEGINESKLQGAGANVLARPARWLIGSRAFPALVVTAAGYPEGAQTLADPEGRIQHMDELGIDVQVIYPTLFFGLNVDSPATELALVEAYHRWMGDICGPRLKRLRWIAPIAVGNPQASAELLKSARDQGAVGVLVPTLFFDRSIGAEQYAPIYQTASDLDLAICVHLGHASPLYTLIRPAGVANSMYVTAPLIMACEAVIKMKLAQKYPLLRWGFIEGSASWIPFLCYRAVTEFGKMRTWRERAVKLFDEHNLFASCEAFEDFDSITPYSTEDRLMLGTDYGHTDPGVELKGFEALTERSELSESLKRKLTGSAAAEFYALTA